ncbi:MAG: Ca2+-dependent phosphoinositide-specific phospholipase C, partial [Microthrixaceae bacterium]
PDAAFLRMDISTDEQPALDDAAAAGYLIRTRTDEPGIHARANDVTLRDSALASGGHYLSTDYYVADPEAGFVVELPGGVVARCNPITAPSTCSEVGER